MKEAYLSLASVGLYILGHDLISRKLLHAFDQIYIGILHMTEL